MDLVSNRGVCWSTEEGEEGWIEEEEEGEEVKEELGEMEEVLVFVRVTVIKRVDFWLSSRLNV